MLLTKAATLPPQICEMALRQNFGRTGNVGIADLRISPAVAITSIIEVIRMGLCSFLMEAAVKLADRIRQWLVALAAIEDPRGDELRQLRAALLAQDRKPSPKPDCAEVKP